MSDFATPRFHKLSEEKRGSILSAAVSEFAEKGYEQANTNRIAASAGISVGALFTYFPNKKCLFLYIVHMGSGRIESLVNEILEKDIPTAEKLEHLLRLILHTSRNEQPLIRLYHELTAAGNAELVGLVARDLESYPARAYATLLQEGVERGEVRPDLHPRMAAFHLDNLFMALQYSYACEYYQTRFDIYVSSEIRQDQYDDFIVGETMKFLRSAIFTQSEKEGEATHD